MIKVLAAFQVASKNSLWNKSLFYLNFRGSTNTEVTVTREGDFKISNSDFMEEINIFKGT